MSDAFLLYITQVLTTFAFVLFAYYLLRYISKKMKFKKKESILAFKTAIVAGAADFLFTTISTLITINKVFAYSLLSALELIFFYILVNAIYRTKWQYSLSTAFFLWVTVFAAELAVILGMLAFLAMYASV